MRRAATCLAAVCFLFLAGGLAGADVLKLVGGREVTVAVLRVTDEGVVTKALTGEKLYKWDDLDAKCAYEYMKRTIDDNDAQGHVKLAKYCLKRKLMTEAKAELEKAKKLKPDLANDVNKIWAESNGEKSRPPLTDEQTRKIVDEQKSMGKKVQDVLGVPVATLETDHFIIHTTFPRGDHGLFKNLCERLYKGFDRIFEISANNDRMWDGKCVVYFFKDRDEFVAFAAAFDNFQARTAGGYFRAEGGRCEVVIPKNAGLDEFMEVMVHEGSHAFLHYYREIGRVPTWVQEGVAQHIEFDEFPKSRRLSAAKSVIARDLRAGRCTRLRTVMEEDRPIAAADVTGYAYAWSYVDCMARTSGRKFAEFIRGLKAGDEPEEAMKKAYGWDVETMQKQWFKAQTGR